MFPLASAPFDNDNTTENTNTHIEKKKSNKNKTLKKQVKPHVEAMIGKIHENAEHQDNDNDMVDFVPPAKPESAGGERLDSRGDTPPAETPQPTGLASDDPFTRETFNDIKSTQIEDYYRANVPYYTQMSERPIGNREELMKKLEKILHLLEEQQDHKSGHVTEELILYSFIGVFIIFVVDSFARAGKYVR